MRFKTVAHEAKMIADKRLKKDASTYWSWMNQQLSYYDRMISEYGTHWGEEYSPPEYGYYSGDKITHALLRRHKGQTDRFGWLVAICNQISMEMINSNSAATLVGGALFDYLEAGMLLADVHTSNVGLVDRFTYSYVITDPGHAVTLKESLASIEIPVV